MQQAGIITVDGTVIGVVEISLSDEADFTPDVSGYEPMGRADEGLGGASPGLGAAPGQGHPHGHQRTPLPAGDQQPRHGGHRHGPGHFNRVPSGQTYSAQPGGRPFTQGSAETDRAIERAARYAGRDPDTMRGIASIESSMNPSSNATRPTQYKGLYQIGHNEWQRFGQGNIYSAEDNAMSAARMFRENSNQFRQHFGREPTDTEIYMMHQQGLGFYTRGAMTNIQGNPYPGMRGPQTHESFEAGWGRELARRKAGFARMHPAPVASTPAMPEDL
jgi:hypothetical protein